MPNRSIKDNWNTSYNLAAGTAASRHSPPVLLVTAGSRGWLVGIQEVIRCLLSTYPSKQGRQGPAQMVHPFMDDFLSRVNWKIIREGKRTKGERGISGENLVYLIRTKVPRIRRFSSFVSAYK